MHNWQGIDMTLNKPYQISLSIRLKTKISTYKFAYTFYIKVKLETQRLIFHKILQRGVGGATPFPGLLHLILDPSLIILSVKQSGIKYQFLSL